jgi:NADH-quinone oxidoreductase subunit J
MVEVLVFGVAAAACLAGAVGVIASRNPVHAALSLVGTLFGIAVLFVAQEAHFLAAVQVIVYAGAIVVLFLFVIMFLGVDQSDDLRVEPLGMGQRIAAGALGLAIVGLVLLALADTDWQATGVPSSVGPIAGEGPDIDLLSEAIFTDYVFAFELTSVLLVIAVVGAVLLARRTPRAEEIVDPGQEEREAQVEQRIAKAAMEAYGLEYAEKARPDGGETGSDVDEDREQQQEVGA